MKYLILNSLSKKKDKGISVYEELLNNRLKKEKMNDYKLKGYSSEGVIHTKEEFDLVIVDLFYEKFNNIIENANVSRGDINRLELDIKFHIEKYSKKDSRFYKEMIFASFFNIYAYLNGIIREIQNKSKTLFRFTFTLTKEIQNSFEELEKGINSINNLGLYWSFIDWNARGYNAKVNPQSEGIVLECELLTPELIDINATMVANWNFILNETEIRLLDNAKVKLLRIWKAERYDDDETNRYKTRLLKNPIEINKEYNISNKD